jgi:hypothetical protein
MQAGQERGCALRVPEGGKAAIRLRRSGACIASKVTYGGYHFPVLLESKDARLKLFTSTLEPLLKEIHALSL